MFLVSWAKLTRCGVGHRIAGPGQREVHLDQARTPETALAKVISDLRQQYGQNLFVEDPQVRTIQPK